MRPTLPEVRRRTRRKELKLSPAEWVIIEERARAAGVTPNWYIREAALGVATGAIAPRGRAATTGTSRELIVAINRIGTNINQLAQMANESGRLPHEADFHAARDELMAVLAQLLDVDGCDTEARRASRKSRRTSAAGAGYR